MLRPVRRKLREIRYHSASPMQTGWTAAADAALLAAVVLAWPATWLGDRLVMRADTVIAVAGNVARDVEDGSYRVLVDRKTGPPPDWEQLANLGRFTLTIDEHDRGWPFTTTISRQPAMLNLDLFDEPAPRLDVLLDADDPLRLAIESGLAESKRTEALSTFRDGPPAPHIVWRNWLAGIGVWWIMLSFGLVASVRLSQFGAIRWQSSRGHRRHQRLAVGHCAECGYDLRGLEFSERCPECGALVE